MTQCSHPGLNCSPLHAEPVRHLLWSQKAPCNPFSFIYSRLISLWPLAQLSNGPKTGTPSALDVNHCSSGLGWAGPTHHTAPFSLSFPEIQAGLSFQHHVSEQTLPHPAYKQTKKQLFLKYFKRIFKSCFTPHPSISFISFRLSLKGKFLNVRVILLKWLLQQLYCLSFVCISLPIMLSGNITLLLRLFISLSLSFF